jgi:glycosyltransferase involved in cell wall biosynthesis
MKQAAEESGLLAKYVVTSKVYDGDDQNVTDSPVAILCGDPEYVSRLYQHKLRCLVLAPNSNGIGPVVADFLKQRDLGRPRIDVLLAPSEWAAEVLRREFGEHRVLVSPHGVAAEFGSFTEADWIGGYPQANNRELRQEVHAEYLDGIFNVLHVTSTATDRKGTPQLVAAWKKLGWKKSKLAILCHPSHLQQHQEMVDGVNGVAVFPTMTMSNYELYLHYSSAHIVCQPSRAEGFGMVPLEARVAGVPVVMTECTGHSQHMSAGGYAGTVTVKHGADAPSEDYPGATAPSVTVDAICDALERARDIWPTLSLELSHQCEAMSKEWSWRNQNEPTMRRLVEMAEQEG